MNKERLISLHESFIVLNENEVISDELFECLDKSRLIRNRISHRYKEPSHEDLLDHVKKYKSQFKEIVTISKKYL
ncbi:HepT-like ribonuclease domain-containing protein [uncultured Clostridium sp.]|uniref:HepT-like ribonuclease domain-containing protein n=1 Tax=uncultured Clostridium sp. TaxID=59620 RepID=UPI0025DEC8C7|nr:HepT-like ribonuclease domain-containing protein [uncultured Clostridium sp.]